MANALTSVSVNPTLAANQFTPPFARLKTPPRAVPA